MSGGEKTTAYRILRELPGGRGWIAEAGNHRVVLKPLDDDCLLDGQIHSTIRLRLQRIQELPLSAVANLYGVEEVDGVPRMVWAYIEGKTLEELFRAIDPAKTEALRRDVLHTVQALHASGIVHGDLHERNVLINDRGAIRLTHASPLLYDDPKQDLDAIERMFSTDISTRPQATAELRFMEESSEPRGIRAAAIVAAAIAAAVGVLIAVFIAWYATPAL